MIFDPFDPRQAVVSHPGCDTSQSATPVEGKPGRWVCECGTEFGFQARPSPQHAESGRPGGGRVARGGRAVVLLLLAVTSAGAQPATLPLVQAADITALPSFGLPHTDTRGWQLRDVAAVSEDGLSLWVTCDGASALARVSIPTNVDSAPSSRHLLFQTGVGWIRSEMPITLEVKLAPTISAFGTATVLEDCAAVPAGLINPGVPNGVRIGGALAWQGRRIVAAFTNYDSDAATRGSIFQGAPGAYSGPYRVGSEMPAITGGYLGIVPLAWRGALGGAVVVGHGGISIASRSSDGPTISVLDPATLGAGNTATLLAGWPRVNGAATAPASEGTYDQPGLGFSGATRYAGIAFPSGTRSVLIVGRNHRAPGDYCYGQGTTTQALHRTPVPGTSHVYCYDTSVGGQDQGTHGWPYVHQVTGFDAAELAAVQAGTRARASVLPYLRAVLPGSHDDATATGAAYDDSSRTIYLTEQRRSVQTTIVRRYRIAVGVVVDRDAVWTTTITTTPWAPVVCPISQQQTAVESTDYTETSPPSGNGRPTPPDSTRTLTRTCVYVPPPVVVQFVGAIRAQATGSYGLRVTLEVPSAQTVPAKDAPVDVPLPAGVVVRGSVYAVSTYANGNWRVTVTLPATSALTLAVRVPE